MRITVALSLPAEVLPQLIAVLEGAPTPELCALADRAREEFAYDEQRRLRDWLDRVAS